MGGEIEKAQEIQRLVFKAKGALNTLEECVSKLRNGFLNSNDYHETKKTINRLDCEIMQIDIDIQNNLQ